MEKTAYFENISPQVLYIYKYSQEVASPQYSEKMAYTYRFFIVTDGKCRVGFERQERMISKGDLVFLRPGQCYFTEFMTGCFSCVNVIFEFFRKSTDTAAHVISNMPFLLASGMKLNKLKLHERFAFLDMPAFNSSFILQSFEGDVRARRFDELFCENRRFNSLRLNSELLKTLIMVVEYIETASDAENSNGFKDNTAVKIIDHIDNHCCEQLSGQSLSEIFSYHPSYIGRLVKKYTGCSLHEYIIRAKLKYATRLLMNNELSVTEIAYKLGFCSSSHFGSIFKAHTGVNPLQFRHEMRECDIAKQAAAHNEAEADNDNKG